MRQQSVVLFVMGKRVGYILPLKVVRYNSVVSGPKGRA